MKSFKNKIILTFAICLTLLFGMLAGVFVLNKGKDLQATNNYILRVEKFYVYFDTNSNGYAKFVPSDGTGTTSKLKMIIENGTYKKDLLFDDDEGMTLDTIQSIDQNNYSDNVFMLQNANLESEIITINDKATTCTKKEYMAIIFAPASSKTKFYTLQVTATHNDLEGNISPISTKEVVEVSSAQKQYAQIYDLTDTTKVSTSGTAATTAMDEYKAQG